MENIQIIQNATDSAYTVLSSPASDVTTVPPSSIKNFNMHYGYYHGYVSSFICIFGVISNIMNMIVLTRRHMLTPTNCILTALALADMVTMGVYLVYAVYFYIITHPVAEYKHSEGWMYFVCINNLTVITCHNMAMWLTVSLAVFRYIFVCHHVVANQLCSLARAKLTIIIVVVATMVVCIPNFFLYRVYNLIEETVENPSVKDLNNKTFGYWIGYSRIVLEHELYQPVTFWIYGVIIKIAPCVLLTILSTCIIYAMHQASKRRKRLLQQSGRHGEEVSAEHNRTTIMLVTVVLFFVITEFPQGILAGISGLNEDFFRDIYSNLGDVMDLLVLINSAINFILYCIMSQQFRDTFTSLFICVVCNTTPLRHHGIKQNGLTYSSVKTEATQV